MRRWVIHSSSAASDNAVRDLHDYGDTHGHRVRFHQGAGVESDSVDADCKVIQTTKRRHKKREEPTLCQPRKGWAARSLPFYHSLDKFDSDILPP